MWAESIALKTSEFILLLLSTVNKQQWGRSIGSHTCPCHNTAATMFGTWCGVLWIVSCSFFFFTILFSSISLVQVDLGFISPKNLIPEHGRLFLDLAKSNLAFLFLNVTSGLHLVVNPLCLHSWRRLLIVDFDNDVPTFSRVFLISVDVMKFFFFTKEKILQSSPLIVFQAFWCC